MKVVVACDGSEHSLQALNLVEALPFKEKEVTLVNVVPLVEYDPEFLSEEASIKIDQFNDDLKEQAKKLLKKSKEVLSSFDQNCETKILTGSPSEKLTELSKTSDLMVMGSRGMNPIKSFFLGSVSDGLIRHSECSVLLFKAGDKYKAPEKKNLNFLVGFDDTDSSVEACSFLKNFDPSAVKSIDLVSVMQMNFYYGMSYSITSLEAWPEYKKTLEESMVETQRDLLQTGKFSKVETDIVCNATDVADELNKKAIENHQDLIVVGSKGKNLMDRVLLGSVSNRLAHHAEVPLLVVR